MNVQHAPYCIRCGRRGSPEMYICPTCGASQLVNKTERVRQVAVVLNELHAPPFEETLEPAQIERVESRYIGELGRLTAPAPRPAAPPAPAPRT